ncbi:MAG: hypothetical protein O7F76_00150 [Planctomycetota bacterium]|nr:hypothetical protein [Planctomycetota bacterium]
MEVHKKTATLRAGLDRAAPGLTDMPVQNGFEESAPTVTVPAFAKDDFETRLATHTFSNDVLQRVPFGTVSNTVEVLSNESTQQAMAKAVTTFASKNRLPIVGIQQLAEPISPSQAFVVRGEPEMNYRPMADQNEEVYLLNMPQEDLEALLLEVQDAAGESAGTLRVVANGQAVKDLNDAGNVVVMAPRSRTLGYAMNRSARDASIKLSFDESMGRELAASEIELTDSAYEADARDDDESDLKRETDPVKPLKKAVRSSEEDELRFKDRGVDKSQPADGAALAKKGSKPDDSNRPAPAKREGFEKSIVGGRRAGSTKTVDAKRRGELGKQSTTRGSAPTSFGWVDGGAANRQFVAFTLSLRAARGAPSGTASSPSGAKASKLVPSSGPTTQTSQPATGRPTSVEPSRGG